MAWLLIKDNVIDSIIAYDGVSPYKPAPGYTLVEYNDGYVQAGWEWKNNAPVEPESEVPVEENN